MKHKTGGSGEIRTRDQRIKSPLLYRLSYRPLERSANYTYLAFSVNEKTTLIAS